MRILFVGDVIGRPGRRAFKQLVPGLRDDHHVDVCIVNGENAAGGRGISAKCSRELLTAGADLITLGNHAFDTKEVYGFIDDDNRFIRPYNLPPGNPGFGQATFAHREGPLVVAQMCGRVFMQPLDCPFRAADKLIEQHKDTSPKRIIIDFHAEATSEKMAFAHYVSGRVAAVIGTHTHVPTADERIFPGGTAYVTDVGMTGPYHSVIGMALEPSLKRLMQLHPTRTDVGSGDVRLAAVLIDIDPETGSAVAIKRLLLPIPSDKTVDYLISR
ncbi:MAG: TIGR00282 family metallophosphoesterase [bacterium]